MQPQSLGATPSTLYFLTSPDSSPFTRIVDIRGRGEDGVAWRASFSGPDWLALPSAAGTVPGSLQVTLNPSKLKPGTYETRVDLEGRSGTSLAYAQTIPVRVTVVEELEHTFLPWTTRRP